jgi:hypothetical protein
MSGILHSIDKHTDYLPLDEVLRKPDKDLVGQLLDGGRHQLVVSITAPCMLLL